MYKLDKLVLCSFQPFFTWQRLLTYIFSYLVKDVYINVRYIYICINIYIYICIHKLVGDINLQGRTCSRDLKYENTAKCRRVDRSGTLGSSSGRSRGGGWDHDTPPLMIYKAIIGLAALHTTTTPRKNTNNYMIFIQPNIQIISNDIRLIN